MKSIVVTAKIFTDEGKPARGHKVTVQALGLANGVWRSVGSATVTATGAVTVKINASEMGGKNAPALRLIEAGSPAPRVLGAGPMMRYDRNRQVLEADFGEIERLEETAFSMSGASSRFAAIKHTVSGALRREGRSEVALNRNLASDPRAAAMLATATRAPGTFAVLDNTATVASAARVEISDNAAAFMKQLDTLRALNIERDSVIVRKDQELSAKKNEVFTLGNQLNAVQKALAEAKARADAADAKIAKQEKDAGAPADVTSVVAGLGTKLSAANATLQKQALPFRIGAVKLDLRGTPSADGSQIVLGGAAGQHGSGVTTELHVDKPTGAAATTKVPDVIGLTENAVRRVLRSVGFRLKPARQTLPAGKGTPGQSILQHPEAGKTATHGDEVLVVFGTAAT